jgi:hypothetical protein
MIIQNLVQVDVEVIPLDNQEQEETFFVEEDMTPTGVEERFENYHRLKKFGRCTEHHVLSILFVYIFGFRNDLIIYKNKIHSCYQDYSVINFPETFYSAL